MAWFSGKVSLGNFPDLAGAVNKLSESVKNIEKNFDSALGLEEKSETTSSTSAQGLWPVMSFMGQRGDEDDTESVGKAGSPQKSTNLEEKELDSSADGGKIKEDNEVESKEEGNVEIAEGKEDSVSEAGKAENETEAQSMPSVSPEAVTVHDVKASDLVENQQEKEPSVVGHVEDSESVKVNSENVEVDKVEDSANLHDTHDVIDTHQSGSEAKRQAEETVEESSLVQAELSSEPKDHMIHKAQPEESHVATVEVSNEVQTEVLSNSQDEPMIIPSVSEPDGTEKNELSRELSPPSIHSAKEGSEVITESASHEGYAKEKGGGVEGQVIDEELKDNDQRFSSASNLSDSADTIIELEKVKREMKMMENALQGAARQAQMKADEIAKLMNENEHLKSVIEDLKRKSNDAEIESLREEYHQRVATLERKVYALTKERDTLRREQNKKSDAAALLKEKDEIITQVMAEGEELSKKQAVQESTIRKLRAQIREFEEEKKGLVTKLQVEENKVDSIKKDKAATEKLLQETIERHQSELAAQKEYYTTALAAAKEAEALAEARVNNEARSELESRLREAEERESMLIQTLEELRQTLSRTEQQAAFREDMLHRDIEDLQKRYQASERRCEELITQVPESTRPLLRQIEAMQETAARRAEAWSAVERSLNSRLQEAEAKAAAAEERERSVNERLSQTLSRISVLEAQISCLRAEQTQISKSLEKERHRAAENRQEYLAAKEEADTQEGRANQLEEQIKELRRKHKQELQDALMQRELLQQEVDREKAARSELEKTSRIQSTAVSDQTSLARSNSAFDNGSLTRRLSTTSSLGSMEESYFLQASLDTSSEGLSERRNHGELSPSPYYMKSMNPSAFESALRQKEGELASYMSRLASMESIRDSLAEELVKMTAQCEKLRTEAALLPGIRAELDALRRRHSAALELMGERDEELEELRADIVDLKEMYREQVNLLVNKIQRMSSSMGTA